LDAEEIYVRLRDERCISLIELIDVNREKTMKGKGWQNIGRTSIGETHHCTFIAAVCTLKRTSVPIIPTDDVRHRPADNHRHHLRDAAQAVAAMKVRSRVARRYPYFVHLRRDAEQERRG
jgi:hypothetical protein